MNKMLKLLMAVTPALFIAACGGGDDSLDDRLDVADPKVRLVHAVPLGPNVSLYRDGVAQGDAANLSYKGATKYFDVSTSDATWAVKTTAGDAAIGQVQFPAGRGNKYTLVAIPGANSATEVINILDPYNKELTANNARVRVLNAAFNNADIDVYMTEPNADLAAVAPTFASVDYRATNPATGSDSLDVTAGNKQYWITITAAGSKTPLFRAPVTVGNNADWLITVLPDTVLLVSADENQLTTELTNTL